MTFTSSVCSAAYGHPQDYYNLQDSSNDSTPKIPFWKTPGSVALRSVIPGLGQFTNHQYWKIPLFYAGFGVCAYFIHDNNYMYQRFKTAYRYRTDNNPATIDEFDPDSANTHPAKEGFIYTSNELLQLREQYRQWRDLTYIITFGLYAANILDAYVYAELKDFNVSPNISMAIRPINFINIAGRNYIVATLKLHFRK